MGALMSQASLWRCLPTLCRLNISPGFSFRCLDALQTQAALCRADLLDHATHCQHSSFWGRGS